MIKTNLLPIRIVVAGVFFACAGSLFAAATEVAEGVYMAPGVSNSYLVVTTEGNLVIDTGAPSTAKRQHDALRAVSDVSPKYIILTHAHTDHAGGIDFWRGPNTKVIAQRGYQEELEYQERLSNFFRHRNAAQFGVSDRSPAIPTNRSATVVFDEYFEFSLGGLTFRLEHTPGETSDHLSVLIPELGVAFVGDNYYDSFPNLYTLRGTKPRWALDYVESLDKVIGWKPSIVLAGHVAPLQGPKFAIDRLAQYRDAILYVHDETVAGMNSAKDVYTLMREIALPAHLDIGQSYGSVSWSVRGIYQGYVGWFDEQPETLFSFPQSVIFPDLVKLAGGPDQIVDLANEYFESGNYVHALHLTGAALMADPKHRRALELRIRVLEGLEDNAGNFNERAWLRNARKLANDQLPKN